MNQNETTKICAVLATAYPHAKELNPEEKVKLWTVVFSEEPYELVNAAVFTYISTDKSGFPPMPGQLKDIIRTLTGEEEFTENDAVNAIMKAIRNSAYNAKEEFELLPPICQRIVGSHDRLHEWSQLPQDETNTVVASLLRRGFVAEKSKQGREIPAAVKKMLERRRDGQVRGIPEERTTQSLQG